MEGVAHDGERDVPLLHQSQQPPEIRVQDGIAAGDVEVGQAVIHLAEIQTISNNLLHLLPGHGIRLLAVVLREDVAVLAPLIALVC